MLKFWKRVLTLMGAAMSAASVHAAAPTCAVHDGTPYCQYRGRVQTTYVNAGNMVILYFDTPAASMNITGVTVMNACAINMAGKVDFAKMFYASALMAQATGRNVTVQMRDNVYGYAGCDRIWVENE